MRKSTHSLAGESKDDSPASAISVEILIIGAGPTGATAALLAAKKGLSFAIVEKREKAIRPQLLAAYYKQNMKLGSGEILSCHEWFKTKLDIDMGDEYFEHSTAESHHHRVQLKDLERVLHRKISVHCDRDESSHFLHPYEVIKIDRERRLAILKPSTSETEDKISVKFKYVFCADGARCHSLTLLSLDEKIEFKERPSHLNEKALAIAYLDVKPSAGVELFNCNSIECELDVVRRKNIAATFEHIKISTEKTIPAWDKSHLPLMGCCYHGAHGGDSPRNANKLGVLIELPESYNTLELDEQRQFLLAWVKQAAINLQLMAQVFYRREHVMLEPSDFSLHKPSRKHSGTNKDQLNITVLPLRLTQASNPAFLLNKHDSSSYGILLGDAALSPFVLIGDGVGNGVQMAVSAIQSISPEGFDCVAYQHTIERLSRLANLQIESVCISYTFQQAEAQELARLTSRTSAPIFAERTVSPLTTPRTPSSDEEDEEDEEKADRPRSPAPKS